MGIFTPTETPLPCLLLSDPFSIDAFQKNVAHGIDRIDPSNHALTDREDPSTHNQIFA